MEEKGLCNWWRTQSSDGTKKYIYLKTGVAGKEEEWKLPVVYAWTDAMVWSDVASSCFSSAFPPYMMGR